MVQDKEKKELFNKSVLDKIDLNAPRKVFEGYLLLIKN